MLAPSCSQAKVSVPAMLFENMQAAMQQQQGGSVLVDIEEEQAAAGAVTLG